MEFCYKAGLNYVSCSPYRVPIARLAAAQAAVRAKNAPPPRSPARKRAPAKPKAQRAAAQE